jgi:hypothetical protein
MTGHFTLLYLIFLLRIDFSTRFALNGTQYLCVDFSQISNSRYKLNHKEVLSQEVKQSAEFFPSKISAISPEKSLQAPGTLPGSGPCGS